MPLTPLDSVLFGGLFGDAEALALFCDEAEIAAMVEFERALARVQGAQGIIPGEAAAVIDRTLASVTVSPKEIARETASAGVPVPGLVACLRRIAGAKGADFVHFGATSQDVVDSSLMLRLKALLALFDGRLATVIARLVELAETHRATPMAARTRGQMATPISFGLRMAGNARDLALELRNLRRISAEGLPLQLGGASGDLAAMGVTGDRQRELTARLAAELGLSPSAPWMTGRRALLDAATLLTGIGNALGKLGADAMISTRTEIGEVMLAEAGGSSTMPQKKNAVKAEAIVALARLNAGLLSAFAATGIQVEERDGIGWMGEWLTLPQMAVATGAALCRAEELVNGLEPDIARMRASIEASNGLMLAEAASFALMAHMSRADAQALVKKAAEEVRQSGHHLFDEIGKLSKAPIDWDGLRGKADAVDAAAKMTDGLLEQVAELLL
ncbi:3-carboxy-cis,cis-muconate cycloisomerase [Stappia sp. F7233]|uniref:3-carboxy-cis,cis-muconate cycloisomerase n=1 Tax=Stappia albiluteola TaxID=2758565 RepID=A0A839AI99_9HYPH|nr:lyase family protein [Stappia albiluteola]MBA5778855.1 3-carboxy-cis,cis-muconate cycloisomerase [Stappia albiluteola]